MKTPSLLTILVSVALTAQAVAAPIYSIKSIGLLPGSTKSIPIDLNNNGDVILLMDHPTDQQWHAVLFQSGHLTELVPGPLASFAQSINDLGQVAGYYYDGTTWQGFVYDHGTFTAFQAPNLGADGYTVVDSINHAGQITGGIESPTNVSQHLFVRQPNGNFSDLGAFGIDPSSVINNQGRIMIDAYLDGRDHVYLTRPGSVGLEEVPSLIPDGSVWSASMNDLNVIAGGAEIANAHSHAFVYANGHIRDLGVLPGGDDSDACGINNFGVIVGDCSRFESSVTQPAFRHAWVSFQGGALQDLNNLLGRKATGWVISNAFAINERGQILAQASLNGAFPSPVILEPTAGWHWRN